MASDVQIAASQPVMAAVPSPLLRYLFKLRLPSGRSSGYYEDVLRRDPSIRPEVLMTIL